MTNQDILVSTVTQYDIKESKKKYYNIYALAQYLNACDNIKTDVESGKSLRAAIVSNLCGRLCDTCLRAVGEPIQTMDERRA